MASVKGAYLEKIRYDSTTLDRIEKYLERENWSSYEWKRWKDSHLEKILYNARKYVIHYIVSDKKMKSIDLLAKYKT